MYLAAHTHTHTHTHTHARMHAHKCTNAHTQLHTCNIAYYIGEVWIDDCDPGWEEIIDTPDHRTRGWYNLATPSV